MSEPTHFEKFADYVISNDGSELSMVKAERDYALHCLEREIAIGERDRASRINRLELLRGKASELYTIDQCHDVIKELIDLLLEFEQ